jgi:phosphonopyruvate decarboxylase
MIACNIFFNEIATLGIGFFTGVPDSTLKDFCSFIEDSVSSGAHVVAANEGGALALAAGHFLATGKPGLVYMQNSGLGNAVNPLASLTDPLVYRIPALLVVGYRGEPGGKKDEPQHAKQGRITLALLDTLGIAYELLPDTIDDARETLRRAGAEMRKGHVFALVVRPGTFETHTAKRSDDAATDIGREEAIAAVASEIEQGSVVVSTTGKISRELYEFRARSGSSHESDFPVVGSMGHSSQVALGIALAQPDKKVFCFDGDGAIIMHMGSLAIIGKAKPFNFRHIVFNNGSHESVGGQPTAGFDIDIPAIARACGYGCAASVNSKAVLVRGIRSFVDAEGPALLEIVVTRGSRPDLGRPTHTPEEIKTLFMDYLR